MIAKFLESLPRKAIAGRAKKAIASTSDRVAQYVYLLLFRKYDSKFTIDRYHLILTKVSIRSQTFITSSYIEQ